LTADTRTRLIVTAMQLFWEKGYGSTSVANVFFPDGKATDEHCFSWQPAGQDAYDVVTEFQVKDGWVPGFKLHMEKVTSAKLKEPKG